ncbi:3-phosphoserine/phosphohydroxythreonine transaminase [Propioniciclava soli]|uniref:Phosphoserine aminotransferase n=1 Tax=Propioniciclava soli TaxID=2775081 RepID=A0ABZ3CCK3_9ACTN|nr:3-phosphoserine/phosphohydroxythreonine transaminase [Propioniciclava soli]
MRAHNFSAGPAMLPLAVLERARDELLDWGGSGMSVMEVSHRGKAFVAAAEATQAALRALMGIPEEYAVLFLQGGAMGEFAAIPMNLTAPGDSIDFLLTGDWGVKAAAEAEKYAGVRVVADESADHFVRAPREGSFTVSPDAAYLHYTPNETIRGVEFGYVPDAGPVPLVADMSSTILSRPVDVSRFGVIYAGAQKNMGPSGLVVVVVRRDLLGRARPQTPTVWDFTVQAGADSMVNTPPTFGIYLLGLVLDWITDQGGLLGMAERNRAKADALYGFIDASGFYSNPVDRDARSWMNVPFLLADPSLDATFVARAADAGLTNLAGHRSVGGMRASIYNAMPLEGVRALVDFMAEFERTHG